MSQATYIVGDVFERMAAIPDNSVDLIVTSPPFLALRSYLPADHPDKHLEIGSEATPAAFLTTMLALTREWRRVLAPHGSICVELGDTYSGSNETGWHRSGNEPEERYRNLGAVAPTIVKGQGWPLAKSLCLLPTLYPASLAYGRNLLQPEDTLEPWRIRNLIVWHRPNPPVGALGDKVRPSTSYITTACVSGTRWFDLDAERTAAQVQMGRNVAGNNVKGSDDQSFRFSERVDSNPAGAPPLDMWNIPTAPYTGSHYATFPPALPRKLINLMCPRQVCTICREPRRRIVEHNGEEVDHGQRGTPGRLSMHSKDRRINPIVPKIIPTGEWSDCGHNNELTGEPTNWRRGIVLDPFAGSGTTLMAASELGRDSIGIDLDPRNLDLARQRCGMFLQEATT